MGEFGSVLIVGRSLCTTQGIDVVRPEPLRATFRMKRTFKGVVRIKVLYTIARLHAKKGVLEVTVNKLPSVQKWESGGGDFLYFFLLFFSRLDNGKYADLRFECVFPEVQKMLWSTKGNREGESKWGSGYAERATFHEGLEHFFKYYVFTGRSLSPSFFPDRGEMPKTPKFSFFY